MQNAMGWRPFGYRILSLVFLCLAWSWANGQQRVGTIAFEGLKKYKPAFLQRQLDLTAGDTVDISLVESDLQFLKNQGGIIDATYRLDTVGNTVDVVFEVREKLTLLPIFNFGGVQGNVWFQAGMTDINWLGIGHQLAAYYRLNDGRHNGNIYYRAPDIGGSKWGASLSLMRWASTEPLYFGDVVVRYDYDNLAAGLTGIRRLGRNHFIEFGGSYFIEEYKKVPTDVVLPGPEGLRQPKYLGKLIHNIDRRNFHFFYLFGLDNRISLQSVYNPGDDVWFHIVLNDTRFFHRVGKTGNLAMRLRLGLATNEDSPFAPFVVDSYVNIRGVGNRVDRGTGQAVFNAEYRQTVFDKGQLAGQVVAFSDLGTWRNPGGKLGDFVDSDNFRHFMGLGVRAIYKKAFNAILRLDYGIDIYNAEQRGFVLGIGQYF